MTAMRDEIAKILKFYLKTDEFGNTKLRSVYTKTMLATALAELFEKFKQSDEVQEYIEACVDAKFEARIEPLRKVYEREVRNGTYLPQGLIQSIRSAIGEEK